MNFNAVNDLYNNNSKRKRTLILAGNSFLVLVAVFSTFGALISAFSFTVNMGLLLFIWFISAIVITAVTMRYRGNGIFTLALPVILLIFILLAEIIDDARLVIREITHIFSKWTPIPEFFAETEISANEPTVFFALAGVAMMFLLAFSICLRRSVFFTILFTVPIVFLTFVITDFRADIIYLFGLIAVYLTLLISSALYPDDFNKRGAIFIPSFVAAMVFMLFVYLLVPHGTYTRDERIITFGNQLRIAASQMDRIGHLWQLSPIRASRFDWLEMRGGNMWAFNTEAVSVADSGNRVITNQSLLEITSNASGIFYLRGYSMQQFDGRSWSVSSEPVRPMPDFFSDGLVSADIERQMPARIAMEYIVHELDNAPQVVEMKIRRRGDLTEGIVYQPYYGGAFTDISEMHFENDIYFFYVENSVHNLAEELRNYGYSLDFVLSEDTAAQARTHEMYTQIGENASRELRQLAIDAGIDPNAERAAIADAVASYIRLSGRYTLSPGAIPVGEDFALYFLRELQEGYCIHFATAAVMMLRSLDVPARFISGYTAIVPAGSIGNSIVLTDRNAHAWVEVFYEDIGWLYLEVTPPNTDAVIPPARPHTPERTPETPNTPSPPPPPQDPDDIIEPATPQPSPDENDISTIPGAGSGSGYSPSFPTWLFNIVIFFSSIAACTLFLYIRRKITLRIRAKRFEQKDTNAAVLYIWRFILRLSRREAIPPNDIEELALKARFSQHRLSEDERSIMLRYAKRLSFEVYSSKDDFGRALIKYFRVLY
ncbi:MAG: transglutaminase-like domain-containing protein [Oscillospiraceae bacterium]|jgi:transglutaminase-like putative cysteine protease|nr:transglutaminase-like domain-containing protein [Oscillospiraceae bacterium]